MKLVLTAMLSSILLSFMVLSIGCSDPHQDVARIAINPWPGYEFLHLAKAKGFFKEEGLNIELVELASLADVQRVYIQGRADAIASTIIEVVHAAGNTQESLTILQLPDYSNGGDIILSHEKISDVKGLKGKRVGAEIGSLGMYILALALNKNGLSLEDVEILNIEQVEGEEALLSGQVDAFVTYPPFSSEIRKHKQFKQILSTKSLPGDVLDSISIRSEFLADKPNWSHKFLNVWDRTLKYAQTHKKEAYNIMATREGISAAEFEDALGGLKLMTSKESMAILHSSQLSRNIDIVCQTLLAANTIDFKCGNINKLVVPVSIN